MMADDKNTPAEEPKIEETAAAEAETPKTDATEQASADANIDGSTPTPTTTSTEAADNQSAADGDPAQPSEARGGRGGGRGGDRGGRDNRGGRGRDNRGGRGRGRDEDDGEELIEKLVHINRVSKTVKGGKRFGFAALVVVGDGQGRVGFGHGKAREVPEAINKATAAAKKKMVRVPLKEGRTLHHDAKGRFGAGKVVVRTAPPGTGIIAGGPMRAVFEALGVADVVTKSVGTSNPYNMIRATFDGLGNQTSPKSVAQRRGKKVADLLGRGGASEAEAKADAEAIAE
ncbi:30S ribosomal protein S5 [Alteriqipengyuania flavescens]|uniref:30S ribosomal protein S5 n=1 Tax=Alteriqipengyuania flavescens TaxID=3053610 RepID=UPI0025B3727F|nr:30S ribosomal protein S5 [Alteriqipengyuania flavescens]WJY20067.1 30S ribosomal protein S5 [Alteriqipengyuania flavescens]WJY26010.1 30S ribosomal protein S5 [Alteriqipengyuania flavescens]